MLMEAASLQRQQIIASLLAPQPEHIADVAVSHWEKLAAEIVSIVGEAGFASLYERTLYLGKSTFPWLPPASSPLRPATLEPRFGELGTSLGNQTAVDARAAHCLLLTIFTDILASLIGDQLTSNILRAAWGNLVSVTAGKELDDE
ncbi:MAG: hypothetical protein R6W80_06480 [Haliea sp.]